MRLWTLHPQYLDSRGLVALWREALLAQKVLLGATRGYRNHPQLHRFRAVSHPIAAIGAYLQGVLDEAQRRSYRFDASKIVDARVGLVLEATSGQLRFEWEHLRRKLYDRAPAWADRCATVDVPLAHPLFRIVSGPVAAWERGAGTE